MRQRLNELRNVLIAALVIQAGVLLFCRFVLNRGVFAAGIILVIEAVMMVFSYDKYVSATEEETVHISEVLKDSSQDAFLYGEVGMVQYDEEYIITWMSELFYERGISRVGTKLLSWIPEAEDLMSGSADTATVTLDDKTYQITRRPDAPVLFFKDITALNNYRVAYQEGMPVIGMASLDNYEESTQYEDESVVSAINVGVRTPLTEYCKSHGILLRRISNSRYLLILNEKIFAELAADRFSVLGTVRKAAQKQDVAITLSMAFARGTENYSALDEMVGNLLDLAQSRGGDQVAVQVYGDEVRYFGGSTEATEKRSRVRVRVMAHTLRDMIARSSNVIICCHRQADFDSIGSAIGIARAAASLKRPVVVIARTGGVEEKLSKVLSEHEQELSEDVRFVTESEALNQLHEDTLVVLVDHSSISISNGPKVIEQASRIAVIDHHRRGTEMGYKPTLVYIETSASSAVELVTELLQYLSNRITLTELEATIMLAGMIVDTHHFRDRTGARTYDAAAALRRMGADPQQAEEFLKESFDAFEQRTSVLNMSERYSSGVVIIPVQGMELTRAMMSQAADTMMNIEDVHAAFVISDTTEGNTAISARSDGSVNVQVIMEAMNGGGHLTAAATQRERCDIQALKQELTEQLDAYFKEAEQDESHTEK